MNQLQILTLELERLSKEAGNEFTNTEKLPFLSVCTTSTHDMNPIRVWWKEDRERTQRYYNQILQRDGIAPEDCAAEIAEQIISRHLNAPSILTIIPLQDWFAVDDTIKRPDANAERINIPSNPDHIWNYRMHITLEKMIENHPFNQKIRSITRTHTIKLR
jgi:4-alpha-glucanotransferase